MAILKCKMCGGNLEVTEEMTVCECEYCGTRQTVPTVDDEKKIKLFERANKLRSNCEFDKAAGVYENIVADYSEEAEGYWGLILCRYGIEYVDDPATGKKIPTCHRSSFDSIMDDEDFEMVMENSDSASRVVYREEAKYIEEVRKGIIEVSGKEESYDIFICYKEKDENGERTLDSVLAQDVYDELTNKGYRVFFSRISLEDKLGVEYEPYIFAALNTAKIMLAFGTSYDHYNAVWVKNEWSRYLKLMAKDKTKHLIPCFRNVDAYDIPKEFSKLQAQDLGKVGAVQDLLRGIEKILSKDGQKAEEQPAIVTQPQSSALGVASLLRRGHLFLEDGEWENAHEYFDKVLDIAPENAEAYLGQQLAAREVHNRDELVNQEITFDKDPLYQKALHFADEVFGAALMQLVEENKRIAEENKLKLQSHRKRTAPAAKCIKYFEGHILGLKADGTVVVTGKNDSYKRDVSGWTDIVEIITTGYGCAIGLKNDGRVVAVGDNSNGQLDVSGWTDIVEIVIGIGCTIGLKSDGRVVAVGDNKYGQCDVSDWTDIVKVIAGDGLGCTVGLKSDGGVVAAGPGGTSQCLVTGWTDIVEIISRNECTVGLQSNGRVLATGQNTYGQRDVFGWTDIVKIIAGSGCTIGLKSDGRVVATGENRTGQLDVSGWTNIVEIIAGYRCTIGLKSDGRVVAAGDNIFGQCDVSDWTDIVEVIAGGGCTVGLKSDGRVVAAGENGNGQCDVSGWTDIVKIFTGAGCTVGLKSDGRVVVAGFNGDGRFDGVSGWRLFQSLDTLEQERKEFRERRQKEEIRREIERKRQEEAAERARKKAEEEHKAAESARKKAGLEREKTELEQKMKTLKGELANLKGLFTGKRRKELELEILAAEIKFEEIETEWKKLEGE